MYIQKRQLKHEAQLQEGEKAIAENMIDIFFADIAWTEEKKLRAKQRAEEKKKEKEQKKREEE